MTSPTTQVRLYAATVILFAAFVYHAPLTHAGQPLEIKLTSERNEIVQWEPLTISLHIKNNGSQAIEVVAKPSLKDEDWFLFISFEGGEYKRFSPPFTGMKRKQRAMTSLAPHNVLNAPQVIFFDAAQGDFPLKAAGKYKLKAVLHHRQFGKIESVPLDVNVSQPKGDDAKAAQLWAIRSVGLAVQTPANDVDARLAMTRLIKLYPKSVFAQHAQKYLTDFGR
jgi:hypothetical protein